MGELQACNSVKDMHDVGTTAKRTNIMHDRAPLFCSPNIASRPNRWMGALAGALSRSYQHHTAIFIPRSDKSACAGDVNPGPLI